MVKQNNKRRYIYRNCRKTFILEDDDRKKYSEEFKDEVIKLYLEGMGIRAIERIKQVPNTVVLQWINKYAQRIRDKATELISNIDNNIKNNVEIMEIDELVTYVKKNLKIGEEEQKIKKMEMIEKRIKEIIPEYGLLLIGKQGLGD